MKSIMAAMALIFFTACSSNIPKDSGAIASKITVKKDAFKNQTWVSTPLYLSRQGVTDTFPVNLKYRALYQQGQLSFIQLYVTSAGMDWGFYHSANGEDGHAFEFVDIDNQTEVTGNIVSTKEHYALQLPRDYLLKMANKDWQIKVYGKRKEGVFVVPASLSTAFADKLNCFELDSCS